MRTPTVLVIAFLSVCAAVQAQVVLCDFEDMSAWKETQKPVAFGPSADAHSGASCVRVTMPGQALGTLPGAYPPADWDRYQGVSFWAKGDGSDQWGCIALAGGGSNGSYTYCYYFPLTATEWTQYSVPWRNWIPEGTEGFIGEAGALPPSGIQAIRIGTRWTIGHNNAKIPEHTYQVDDVVLEETVAPPGPAPAPAPLAGVIAKLRAKQPVRIVCMGDSITAGTGLPNKDAERYAVILQGMLREALGYEEIHAESRAVGGAKLSDAQAWVLRDFQGPAPDLVTMMYGYNDKSNKWSSAQYAAEIGDYVDRVAAVTGGQTAILPLATMPGAGPRFTMLDDFAQAVRDVCAARGIECCDMQAAFKAVGREGMPALLGDMAHPNAEGHRLMARTLADFLMARVSGD